MKTRNKLAVASRPLRRGPSPLGALFKGLLAGAAGAFVQSQFFRATAKITPKPTKVSPAEGGKPAHEAAENNLETVARRFVDDLMLRGPLEGDAKKQGAGLVHYLFGAGWGGLYGLARESLGDVSPALFGAIVWMLSDNVILPAFRLAGWPQKYSAKEHAYALNAHFAYGWGTAGTYGLIREVGVTPLAAIPALLALRAQLWLRKTPPGKLVAKRQPLPTRFFWQAASHAFAQ